MSSNKSLAQREHPNSGRVAVIAILVIGIVAVFISFLLHSKDVNLLTKKELVEILQKPVSNVEITYNISSDKHCHCKFFAQGVAVSQGKVLTKFVIYVYGDEQEFADNDPHIPDPFQRHTIEAGGMDSNFVFALDRDVTLSFSESLSASYYRFIRTMQERLDSKTLSKYESGALPQDKPHVAREQENNIDSAAWEVRSFSSNALRFRHGLTVTTTS